MKILILNGPNLNLLGRREPTIYGNQTMESFLEHLRESYPFVEIAYYQSNHEGALIDCLHDNGFGDVDGIVFNAGAYTHTSLALADAIAAINTPVVEVHISDIYKREPIRHHSMIKDCCVATFAGFGLDSYRRGIDFIISLTNSDKSK